MRAAVLRETPLLIGLLTLVGLATTNLLDWLLLQPALPVLTGLALLSLLVLLMARGVAHHADQLAERLGEPLRTLVLTGSVIVIELALIVSTMLTGETNPTLARDSMFSVLIDRAHGGQGHDLDRGGEGAATGAHPADAGGAGGCESERFECLHQSDHHNQCCSAGATQLQPGQPRSQLLPADKMAIDVCVDRLLRDFSARPGGLLVVS